MTKNDFNSYEYYARRNKQKKVTVSQRPKVRKKRKSTLWEDIKYFTVGVLAAIFILYMLLGGITLDKFTYTIQSGDNMTAIENRVRTDAMNRHGLINAPVSGLSDMYIFQDWYVIHPDDQLEIEVKISPLGSIFKIATVEYYITRAADIQSQP